MSGELGQKLFVRRAARVFRSERGRENESRESEGEKKFLHAEKPPHDVDLNQVY
jgi:hypothetical protein